jgi:UDP-N-acetylglucosamine 3-dehydrogenase
MSEQYRVAVIGAGRPWRTEGSTGFGMSHVHVHGYQKTGKCRLTAVADIKSENAEAFAAQHVGPAVFTDYREMLERERPDIVSVCTWPALHAEMVVACAEAGAKAVHCEKPMATTWGDARRMVEVCEKTGTQLTFNHQRRFLAPFQTARDLLRQGVIGELRRLEAACGDLYDWGTHWIDMCLFYNKDTPAVWVLGQIDAREPRSIFGVPLENQGLSEWKYENGVRALLFTGHDSNIGCANRLIGADGTVEVHNEQPHVRFRGRGDAQWRTIETPESLHGNQAIDKGIADLIEALEHGREPELSGRRALRTTEVIFATYESSRRRARIDLPLTGDARGLQDLLEAREIGPGRQ